MLIYSKPLTIAVQTL